MSLDSHFSAGYYSLFQFGPIMVVRTVSSTVMFTQHMSCLLKRMSCRSDVTTFPIGGGGGGGGGGGVLHNNIICIMKLSTS